MSNALVIRTHGAVSVHDLNRQRQRASSIEEVKGVADKAAAWLKYAKRAKRSRAEQNRWAVVRLLAERRMGELLNAMDRHRGRPAKGSQLKRLSEIGIDSNQSHRWRAITKISPDDLEAMHEDCDRMDRALTSEYVMRQIPKEGKPALPWRQHWSDRKYENEVLTDINRLYRAVAVFLAPPRKETGASKKTKALVEAMEFVLPDESYLNEHDWVRLRDAFRHVRMFAERGETGAEQQLRRFVNPLDGLLRFIDRRYWPARFRRSA